MIRLPLLVAALLLLCCATDTQAQGSALFDDSTDVIQVDGQTVIGSAATYEAVVLFPSGLGAGGTIFNEWTISQEDKRLNAGPSYVFGYNFPASGALQHGVSMMPDVWHHVAFVTDGAEDRLFLDGVLQAVRPSITSVGDGPGLAHIGAIFRDGVLNPGFVGYLESIRLSDVARYVDSTFTPPLGDLESDSNTLLLLNFNEAAGSPTVMDESPLARLGTPGVGFDGATAPEFGTSPPATECALSTTTADLWDISRGAVITSSTGFLSGSDTEGENIFGGTFSTPEEGTAFFRDDQAAGFVHAVEWETTGDLTVGSFVLTAAHDGNSLSRSFNLFRLLGFNTTSNEFDLLYEFEPSIPYGGGATLNNLMACANLPVVTTNRFRAEFVQHHGGGFPGPRVYELDAFSTPKGTPVSTEVDAEVPTAGLLNPAYPNPTSGLTALPYDTSVHGHVRLAVYDVLGREVEVLFDGRQAAGRHEAVMQAGALPPGVYFVQLTTPDGFRQTRGLTVVR